MIERKLDNATLEEFRDYVRKCDEKCWEIDDEELKAFYDYLFEDVKEARSIFIHFSYTGNGFEVYDEVKFNDNSVHYFFNGGGKPGENLQIKEMYLSDEVLKHKQYNASDKTAELPY